MSIDVASAMSGSKELTTCPARTRATTGAAEAEGASCPAATALANGPTNGNVAALTVASKKLRREIPKERLLNVSGS